jgi:hypothetical protein
VAGKEIRERERKKKDSMELPPVGSKKKGGVRIRDRGEGGLVFPKDPCVNTENCKGLTVKQNFPLI